jgi:hypothetical protein
MAEKAVLTFEEIIKVAYLYHVMKVEQHALSIAFSVNSGRIAEACMAMSFAAKHVKDLYQQAKNE